MANTECTHNFCSVFQRALRNIFHKWNYFWRKCGGNEWHHHSTGIVKARVPQNKAPSSYKLHQFLLIRGYFSLNSHHSKLLPSFTFSLFRMSLVVITPPGYNFLCCQLNFGETQLYPSCFTGTVSTLFSATNQQFT